MKMTCPSTTVLLADSLIIGIDGVAVGASWLPRQLNTVELTFKMSENQKLSEQQALELDAAAFRRLLQHLDDNKQVQNIELMNLAGFCRNCLAKWYAAEAQERHLDIDYEHARERVYGMPYAEWKNKYQTPMS